MLPAQPVAGFRWIHEGENFLLINDAFEERVISFGTKQNVCRMAEVKSALDGIFYSCHSLFKQLYAIHVVIRRKMVPIMYTFPPNKTTARYTRLM